MGRRLAVSDIHGEGRRLIAALKHARYSPGADRLFVLGDLIDRGSDSPYTVTLVQQLERDGAIVLRGNHDVMPQMVQRNDLSLESWFRVGGGYTWYQYGGMPPEEVITWLATRALYHEGPDCILVHAGLLPGIVLQEQTEHDVLWIRDEFHRGYTGKRVIFGHTPTPLLHGQGDKFEIWHGPDKTGIDTGAAWGGRLTVIDIDTNQTWWA